MTVNYTSLLSLGQPITGTESGTWGNVVNNSLSSYLDIAIAGTLTLTGDGPVTLSNTQGTSTATNIGSTTAQYYVIKIDGVLTTTKVITAPSASKTYVVINTSGQSVTFKASGQTGVSIPAGTQALVAFNGTDYVTVGSGGGGGSGTFTDISVSGNATFSGGTINGVAYLNGSKQLTTGNNLTFNGTNVGIGTSTTTQALSIVRSGGSSALIDLAGGGRTLGTNSLTFGQAAISGDAQFLLRENAKMQWGTNGAMRLTLTSTGDLGLGTDTPGSKFTATGLIESTSGGFKFPDGTIQTTAGGGGGSTDWANPGAIGSGTPNTAVFTSAIGKGGAIGHHVDAYGAVGNGSTNDTAAIQAAIDAAKAGTNGSNVVVFGAKNYRINSTLNVALNNSQSIALIGMPPGVNAANTAQAQGTRLTFASTSASAIALHVQGDQGTGATTNTATVTIRNLWIGVNTVNQAAGQVGLQIGNTGEFLEPYSKIILDNVQCWKFSGAGIKVVNTHRVAMYNCITYNPGDGGSAIGLYILSTGGYFCGGVLCHSCEFTAGAGSGTTERAVKIEAAGSGPYASAYNAGNMFVNTVLYYGEVGMEIYASGGGVIGDIYIDNFQIDGYLTGGGIADPNVDYALYIHTDSDADTIISGVKINNSYFTGWRLHGIYIQGQNTANGATIRNVAIQNTDVSWCNSHGIKLENVWGFSVVGNNLRNNGNSATAGTSGGDANIHVTTCQYFSVASNSGYLRDNVTNNAYGVFVAGGYSDGFSIVNNSMTAGYASYADNSTGINKTISGNYGG